MQGRIFGLLAIVHGAATELWEHLIFVKTLLLAPSFFLFPSSSFLLPRSLGPFCLKTPISSLTAFIEMLPELFLKRLPLNQLFFSNLFS
ncbi:hypothetical protein QUA89_19230 [Microcoleus sp. F10-B4]